MRNKASQITPEPEWSPSPARKRIDPLEEAAACAERLRKEFAEFDVTTAYAQLGMDWREAAKEIAARAAAMRNRGEP